MPNPYCMSKQSEISPAGGACLLVIWLLIIIINAISALVEAIANRLAHVDWVAFVGATLALICFSGLLFLAYLPIADWLENRRRLQRWRKQHQLDIELLDAPPSDATAPASGRRTSAHPALDAPGVCPYCQTPIATDADGIRCPACRTPHHRQCWQENGGCAVYGCRGGKIGAR